MEALHAVKKIIINNIHSKTIQFIYSINNTKICTYFTTVLNSYNLIIEKGIINNMQNLFIITQYSEDFLSSN